MKVEILELRRRFGTTDAVDGLSFSFGAGQIYGFVGPNGAGKTTTMRILATLDEPTSGDARVDGRSVVEHPEHARQLIGYMPDGLPTHRDMNVDDYLDFFARAYRIDPARRRRVVERVQEFTSLTGIRHKKLAALSKGMKQRVSLARAMIHDPPLLVMDEPANGLDPRARIELRELLRALAAQGKAILISSHILTELAEICDGAVIIEKGRMLLAGTMEQMLRGPAQSRRSMVIRPTARLQDLHRVLLETPGVDAVRLDGPQLECDLAGDEEACCDLLADLLRQGFRIAEFRQRRADLEQVFMQLTRGEVQ